MQALGSSLQACVGLRFYGVRCEQSTSTLSQGTLHLCCVFFVAGATGIARWLQVEEKAAQMREEQEINRKIDMHMEMERLKANENYEVGSLHATVLIRSDRFLLP